MKTFPETADILLLRKTAAVLLRSLDALKVIDPIGYIHLMSALGADPKLAHVRMLDMRHFLGRLSRIKHPLQRAKKTRRKRAK